MTIYDQLFEIHSQLENDEMWLTIIEGYFEEYEVDNIDDFIDKLAEAEIEGVVYTLINEGEDLLSLKDTNNLWFDEDDEYSDYDNY
jgi:vacuolar-type H+-ATPase subunit I/STV1